MPAGTILCSLILVLRPRFCLLAFCSVAEGMAAEQWRFCASACGFCGQQNRSRTVAPFYSVHSGSVLLAECGNRFARSDPRIPMPILSVLRAICLFWFCLLPHAFCSRSRTQNRRTRMTEQTRMNRAGILRTECKAARCYTTKLLSSAIHSQNVCSAIMCSAVQQLAEYK